MNEFANKSSRIKGIIAFILCLYIFTSCAASPRPEQSNESAESTEYSHSLTFMAYGRGAIKSDGKKSIAGHASISLDRVGAWGFWPTTPGRMFTKTGLLRDTGYDDEYLLQQEYLEFPIDETTYMQILNLINEWKRNPPIYLVPTSDCVTFIYRVCKIAGIRYNSFALVPTSAIREIRRLNMPNGEN